MELVDRLVAGRQAEDAAGPVRGLPCAGDGVHGGGRCRCRRAR
ncbi:hypothetical protein D805_0836 [Bifidobacterium thermophilum RBL67]|uniref:Uncharacterized protein n=1 Tax=Bifidobacterium thermophilum RBL67 TaxID=1254439 RepID=M4REX3_9BIFI|nr:hypothetical protein D805_0836 [Bifidobacterium thermophilum RBL67]